MLSFDLDGLDEAAIVRIGLRLQPVNQWLKDNDIRDVTDSGFMLGQAGMYDPA